MVEKATVTNVRILFVQSYNYKNSVKGSIFKVVSFYNIKWKCNKTCHMDRLDFMTINAEGFLRAKIMC